MAQYDPDLMLKEGQQVRLVKQPRLASYGYTYTIGQIGTAKFSMKDATAFGVYFDPAIDSFTSCYADEIEFI